MSTVNQSSRMMPASMTYRKKRNMAFGNSKGRTPSLLSLGEETPLCQ